MLRKESIAEILRGVTDGEYLHSVREMHGGVGILVLFGNGYGADVVCHQFSYGWENGDWELAVVRQVGYGGRFELVYDTPIADDVIGYLDAEEVLDFLKEIEKLPEA